MPKINLPWHSDPPPKEHARPLCKGGCGKHLRPRISRVFDNHGTLSTEFFGGKAVGLKFSGHYDGYDGFHSLRCALDFARAAYAKGYRRREVSRGVS